MLLPKGAFGWMILEFTPVVIVSGLLFGEIGWRVIFILLAALWLGWWAHSEGEME